jgi:hypothetical protein
LELLKEALPKVHSVAILSNPANPAHPLAVSNVKAAAGSLGVQLQLLEAGEPHQFDGAFATMARHRVDALLVVSDGMFVRVLREALPRLSDLRSKAATPRETREVGRADKGLHTRRDVTISSMRRRTCGSRVRRITPSMTR